MPRLVPVDARIMGRVLQGLGFARVRQKGSHVFYRHPDGRTTTVPSQGPRSRRANRPRDPRRHPALAGRIPAPAPILATLSLEKTRNPARLGSLRFSAARVRSCADHVRKDCCTHRVVSGSFGFLSRSGSFGFSGRGFVRARTGRTRPAARIGFVRLFRSLRSPGARPIWEFYPISAPVTTAI